MSGNPSQTPVDNLPPELKPIRSLLATLALAMGQRQASSQGPPFLAPSPYSQLYTGPEAQSYIQPLQQPQSLFSPEVLKLIGSMLFAQPPYATSGTGVVGQAPYTGTPYNGPNPISSVGNITSTIPPGQNPGTGAGTQYFPPASGGTGSGQQGGSAAPVTGGTNNQQPPNTQPVNPGVSDPTAAFKHYQQYQEAISKITSPPGSDEWVKQWQNIYKLFPDIDPTQDARNQLLAPTVGQPQHPVGQTEAINMQLGRIIKDPDSVVKAPDGSYGTLSTYGDGSWMSNDPKTGKLLAITGFGQALQVIGGKVPAGVKVVGGSPHGQPTGGFASGSGSINGQGVTPSQPASQPNQAASSPISTQPTNPGIGTPPVPYRQPTPAPIPVQNFVPPVQAPTPSYSQPVGSFINPAAEAEGVSSGSRYMYGPQDAINPPGIAPTPMSSIEKFKRMELY